MDELASGRAAPGAQRLRVFVSTPIGELSAERAVATEAIAGLLLAPVLFEMGTRSGSPRALYKAYLDHSDVFVGIYWQRYGFVSPSMTVSELEDQYDMARDRPRLIYIKEPAPERDPRLQAFIHRIEHEGGFSYKIFSEPGEVGSLLADDLALLLTERFDASARAQQPAQRDHAAEARLPAPPTPLLGRDADVRAVADLIAGDEARLVTLTGPGGIGKTRLALGVATALEDQFADGVWLVPVAPLRDPALVAPTIAFRLGIRESAGTSPFEALKGYLSDKHILLVLDSFERVVAAGPLVADLLAAAPGLRVLVTSRALLRVRGEREYPVLPLEVPADDGSDLTPLGEVAAIRLFVERAEAANPAFRLTSDNIATVAEICRRLEGLPLAIELAAARTRLLPPQALLARLTSRLQLLTGGAADLPERQRTLRAAIDWDYELLDPAEQVLFMRLGVFVHGWTLDAADTVTDVYDATGLDLLDGMDSLLGKSLVRQYPPEGMEPRFGMLETLREYALEKLVDSDDEDAVRRRHAKHFVGFAQQARHELRGPDQAHWLLRLEHEHDNMRAVLRWADDHVEVEILLSMCAALGDFWRGHAHFSEGRRWLERALSLSVGQRNELRADLLEGAAGLARARGDFKDVEVLLRTALDLREELGEPNAIATTLRLLGNARYELDDPDGAEQLWLRSLDVRPPDGDQQARAATLNNLGVVVRDRHDLDAAASYYRDALAIFRRLRDEEGIARALMNLGNLVTELGDPKQGAKLLREALSRFHGLGNTWDIVDCLDFLAGCVATLGASLRAGRLFGASAAIREAIGAARAGRDKVEYDRSVQAARDASGDAHAFDAEWSLGRSMRVDAVVAYAMEDGQDAGAPGPTATATATATNGA